MIKKLLCLAATAVFSMNASASYIQYNLTGPVSGWIVQSDDKAVVYYQLDVKGTHIGARFSPSGPYDTIKGATTNFDDSGPTNVSLYDNQTDYYREYLDLNFNTDLSGGYSYAATYAQYAVSDLPGTAERFEGITNFSGKAVAVEIDQDFGANLAAQGTQDGVPHIIPTRVEVPEPASLSLIALGALSAIGVGRRSKKTL